MLKVTGQRSAWPSVDNCWSDHAVRNGRQLVDLLRKTDPEAVVEPAGEDAPAQPGLPGT